MCGLLFLSQLTPYPPSSLSSSKTPAFIIRLTPSLLSLSCYLVVPDHRKSSQSYCVLAVGISTWAHVPGAGPLLWKARPAPEWPAVSSSPTSPTPFLNPGETQSQGHMALPRHWQELWTAETETWAIGQLRPSRTQIRLWFAAVMLFLASCCCCFFAVCLHEIHGIVSEGAWSDQK